MKKIYVLLLAVGCGIVSFGQTIFSESMGTPAGTTLIPAYVTGTAPATFQNGAPIVFSGTADVRVTTPSTYVGASGGGNVWLASTASPGPYRFFQIDGINTSAFSTANIQMSFGYLTSPVTSLLVLEYSTNASSTTPTWTPITFTNNTTISWTFVTVAGGILPSSTSLSLRFTGSTTAMRVDDVRVFNFNPACTLVLGAPSGVCNAITSAVDTYTTTIPYTGGGSGSYTITPSSGTVSGDSPATVASGNIIVSGIPEGTNLTVSIASGSCSYSTLLNSPECKIVNLLPFNESFNYTVASALTTQQAWSKLNTGDDIAIAAGNLSYTGITSAGNSISFLGAGGEAKVPFTAASTGAVFASFLCKVADIANVTTDLASTYFAFFGSDNAGASTNARLWIRRNGTQIQFGLGAGSSATDWTTALYNVNDTLYLVLGYDVTNNFLSLTINPVIGSTSSATLSVNLTAPILTIGSFVFRQDGDTSTPSLVIDELKISTAPDFTLKSNSIAEIDGLNMYPNPVSGSILNIETAASGTKAIAIFDVLGKQVFSVSTDNTTLNVGNLNAGVYIVKITEEGKTATRKLIVR